MLSLNLILSVQIFSFLLFEHIKVKFSVILNVSLIKLKYNKKCCLEKRSERYNVIQFEEFTNDKLSMKTKTMEINLQIQ